MISLQEIRKTFLDFFQTRGHAIVRSSPLIPHNDPSLLFTNAGMVQFKDIFTGLETPKFSRVVTAQKCLRAGGKHNDLDNVGYTARHHTFFEMLGNFSFGDYFKEEAITYAWELITQVFCLDPKRLWVTVYSEDTEAETIWKKHIASDRILKISTQDNFWMMGDTGPCGPCSEIFYDHGEAIEGGLPGTKDENGDRFTEVWNLVFMQYEQKEDGTRVHLPKPSVDTGMGLERMVAVLQGVHDNYQTDLFKTLIQESLNRTQPEPYQSHRVIADHLRACAFLIADGILPSNEGRGYVLRRIMRRSMRHAYLLGAKEALMWKLIPRLVHEMGDDYPELKNAESLIKDSLKAEEERFRQTLDKGLKLLQDETDKLTKHQALPGEVAFKLYDTYGFPLDLTQDVLRAENRAVDLERFKACMDIQRDKARAGWSGSGEKAYETMWRALKEKHGATNFVGYEVTKCNATILALLNQEGRSMETLSGEGFVLTDCTPFYGESGGQKGDRGTLETPAGQNIIVDTVRKLDLILHNVSLQENVLHVGQQVTLIIDHERREAIARHHSATHLLHSCLRHVLGDHVAQKGSLVEDNRLRFDFTHFSAMTHKQIEEVEQRVNQMILKNEPVNIMWMPYEEALQTGAMALFGEKYSENVRVVQVGKNSTELCGGTHVIYTGDIGLLHITQESGVSAGVRRIEAVAGHALTNYWKAQKQQWAFEKEKLNKSFQTSKKSSSLQKSTQHFETFHVKDVHVYTLILQDTDTKQLKALADQQRAEIPFGVIIIATITQGRVSFVVAVEKLDFNAIDLVKKLSHLCGGQGGGGRADLAQGGGVNAEPFTQLSEVMKGILF